MWCMCGVWCVCGVYVVCMWCVCGVWCVACMWCVCGVYVVCVWCVCGVCVVCMWCVCGVCVVCVWCVCHACQLTVEVGDDFAHCLCGTSGGWNDVLVGTAAITPGLGAGTIHCLLGGCVCMDCSHESLLNSKVIMDDFGQGGQAVGGAGGITDDGHGGGVIFVLVDSHDKHWSIR